MQNNPLALFHNGELYAFRHICKFHGILVYKLYSFWLICKFQALCIPIDIQPPCIQICKFHGSLAYKLVHYERYVHSMKSWNISFLHYGKHLHALGAAPNPFLIQEGQKHFSMYMYVNISFGVYGCVTHEATLSLKAETLEPSDIE